MGCPLNKKKWWIFSWEGPHDWLITWVGVWAFELFEIKMKCQRCTVEHRNYGIEGESIIRRGFDIERARKCNYWGTKGYDPREELNNDLSA